MRKELASRAVKMTNIQLRQHNSLLRKNLQRVVSCSTDNEEIQERMDEVEKLIFAAPTFKEMFDTILIQGRRIFKIELITVCLEPEMLEFYPADYKKTDKSVYLESDHVIFLDPEDLSSCFTDKDEPVLRGNLRSGTERFFPNGKSRRVRSEAITPMAFEGRLFGAIAFGSQAPSRFMEGYGSRFLKRMTRLIVLKVELFLALRQSRQNVTDGN